MVKNWRPMKLAPKGRIVKLLGTVDTTSDLYVELEGIWNDDVNLYTTESGWCIIAVAWREQG